MENPEDVMQLLEVFSKIKPKDIPKELEDYLGYVAKTGDPVYQWTLVKHLFREKLLAVITEFYESTLSVELPPCPNVEVFNYERMKNILLERFDTFVSAPFTVQRICELLTNPRKEYNRADKYMRAMEKNILVVSTREPGTGKRSLDCDNQAETVINGLQDLRSSISDSDNLSHVSTDLPFVDTPSANNDVIVETTELSTIPNVENIDQELNLEDNIVKSDDKTCSSDDTNSASSGSSHENTPPLQLESTDSAVFKPNEAECIKSNSYDAVSELSDDNTSSLHSGLSKISGNLFISQGDCETVCPPDTAKENEGCTNYNDEVSNESEVSSLASGILYESNLTQEEFEDQTGSQQKITDLHTRDNVETVITNNDKIICNTCEKSESEPLNNTSNQSEVVMLECNELANTAVSTFSPEIINKNSQPEEIFNNHPSSEILGELNKNQDLCPDSSSDIYIRDKVTANDLHKPVISLEAESSPETTSEDTSNNSGLVENAIQSQQIMKCVEINSGESLNKEAMEGCIIDCNSASKLKSEPFNTSEISLDESEINDSIANMQCSSVLVNSNHSVNEEILLDQSLDNTSPKNQQDIKELSVNTSCAGGDEEAMDVDDSSNQMMVSEGENEEPMDQSDLLNS